MDQTPMDIVSFKHKKELESSSITDLSPVTNLTLNLCGLSTSNAGTPIRRISWSHPTPERYKAAMHSNDVSYSESPQFQEIFPRRRKFKQKLRKCFSKVIPSDSEDEKENLIPHDLIGCSPKDEDNIPCSSQDSGYSCMSETCSLESPSPSLQFKGKSIFTDDEDQSFENIFQLEEMDEANKLSPVPKGMFNLLSDPLSNSLKSPHRPSKYKKLPIRRCLSMDMDSESDSSASESAAKVETYIAPSIFSCKTKQENEHLSKPIIFKRPEPPNDYQSSFNKRRKSCAATMEPCQSEKNEEEKFVFQRSFSETAATIMHALLKADLQPELVGDGSRSYALPLIKGRHQDLKSISPATLVGLMKGEFKNKIDNFTLIDCRYPYEFEGGHIQGAKNIYTKEDIMSAFLESTSSGDQKNALIFHCEFSSERAPTLCRFLRNKDRELNEGHYPRLYHPEMYILEGGYKAFFEKHKELCEPQDYKPMNHKDHGFDLRHFRAKSKSWGADSKNRYKLRSSFKNIQV